MTLHVRIVCVWYRVSQKKRPTLVLLISQLSRGLEIPSWTFFNSPFRVEFKNVHFLSFGDIWTEILPKYLEAVIFMLDIFVYY